MDRYDIAGKGTMIVLCVVSVILIIAIIMKSCELTEIASKQGCRYIGISQYAHTPLMECDGIVKVVRGK